MEKAVSQRPYQCQFNGRGNAAAEAGTLRWGLIDFSFIVEPPNLEKYNYIELPRADIWGLQSEKFIR